MVKYELKKIFSKTGSKIAVLLLFILLGITCFTSIHEMSYVNEKGESTYGYTAAQKLKRAKKEWRGELTTKQLKKVIAENQRIEHTPESDSDIAYSWKQGFSDIHYIISFAFGEFQNHNYYKADSLSEKDMDSFYEKRISSLQAWLDTEADTDFTPNEKTFLLDKYKNLSTPFYYDDTDGWQMLINHSSSLIMLMLLILGFLVADIFSGEFLMKSDSIFFSSYYGKNKATRSKILASILLTTILYWVTVLLYSGILLGLLGADGATTQIQTSSRGWKSFYSLNYIQEYFLIVLGGYIGSLFILALTMLISAKTKSTVLAVILPFILIFIPNFMSNIPALAKILNLFPDQLLQLYSVFNKFNLYQFGGKVVHSIPILFVGYSVFSILLYPLIYHVYRRAVLK